MTERSITTGGLSFVIFNDNTWAVELKLDDRLVNILIPELSLLAYDLSPALEILSNNNGEKLFVTISKNSISKFKRDGSINRVTLSINDIETLMAFVLRYFRDGIAAVKHLDIDICESNMRANGTFMLTAEKVQKPISATDANKCFGIE
jgi:hypothetical protein